MELRYEAPKSLAAAVALFAQAQGRASVLAGGTDILVQMRGGRADPEARKLGTPSGKIELYSSILEKLGYDPLPYYEEPPESPLRVPDVAKVELIGVQDEKLFVEHVL